MTMPSREDIEEYTKTLKAGDWVSVLEFPSDAVIYRDKVRRVTPHGFIKLETGRVFKLNGFMLGGSTNRLLRRHLWRADVKAEG
jgi:hypothetical protein